MDTATIIAELEADTDNVTVMSGVILFTTIAPDPLTDGLSHQGYQVHEALAISEVLSLVEHRPMSIRNERG